MRAFLTVLLLLAAPAAAAAKPLDADRSFARGGVLRIDDAIGSSALIALRDGGTLHATNGAGIMRLDGRGRRVAGEFLGPAGTPEAIAPAAGGALVVGSPAVDYLKPTPLGVWFVDRDGRTLSHLTIPFPNGESGAPLRLVRRGRGYVALVRSTPMDGYRQRYRLVALTAGGALDTTWGKRGFHRLPAGETAVGAARDGTLVIATALQTRCDRRGFSERREQAVLRVQRLGRRGAPGRLRRMRVGGSIACPFGDVGEVLVERRGRIVIGAAFGRSAMLLRLRRDFTRDRRFGRGGLARIAVRSLWWSVRVERRPGRGYAFAVTDERKLGPYARVGLADSRGRRLRTRGLKRRRAYPHSLAEDIAIDRRGGIVAAGSLFDTDAPIREDYGMPHLAVWRVRTS